MTLADPIRDNADHAGGHHWTPNDFKQDMHAEWKAVPRNTLQPDIEHLDRRGLQETQIDGTHYLGKRFQVWDIVEEYGLDYFEGSILAYLLRRKPGVPRAIDLRNARHYLDKCIAREEAKT